MSGETAAGQPGTGPDAEREHYWRHMLGRIDALFATGDVGGASQQLALARAHGVDGEALAALVYRRVIEPEEGDYRRSFSESLALLTESRALFADRTFEFEAVKRNTTILPLPPPVSRVEIAKERAPSVLVDVLDAQLISDAIAARPCVYLVYNDPHKFHALLLFFDLAPLREPIQERRLLVFVGPDRGLFRQFLETPAAWLPSVIIDQSRERDYDRTLQEVLAQREQNQAELQRQLAVRCRTFTRDYYKALFTRSPADIRIAVVTSVHTQVNQHIARNWLRSFRQLGYTAHLIVEHEPYQVLTGHYLYDEMVSFRPDIVFHVNWSIDHLFTEEDVRANLLWMMRFRDANALIQGAPSAHNMFVFCHLRRWFQPLLRAGLTPDRVLYLPEGVDTRVFAPRVERQGDARYACDVVSVNNVAGADAGLREELVGAMPDDKTKQVVRELCDQIARMAAAERYLFFEASLMRLLDEKLAREGIEITEGSREYIAQHLGVLMGSFFRRHVIEWILDAGITSNVRVWGRGWGNYPRFRAIHRGIAGYGEELAAIYQNSKIAISDQNYFTMHERNFEVFASGGFPLIKLSDPQEEGVAEVEDLDVITNYFPEGEEVVTFRGKDDLLEKVAYYLEHAEQRERVANLGRARVRREFSTDRITQKAMEYLKGWYATH